MSLTEQCLVNHGGKAKLDEIETLDLANLKLTTKDLEGAVKLFGELTSLDELDLSGNAITTLPDGFPLHECRVLNLSHNQLESVAFLENYWTIEEIDLSGNGQIDIIERMKLRILLPKCAIINGEPTDDKDPALAIANQLKTRLGKLFNDSFKAEFNKLKQESSLLESLDEDLEKETEDYQRLAVKFVERAKKVPAGPGSVRKFRTWLAERLAQDILDDDKHAKKEVELSFYQKMKKKRKIESNPKTDEWRSNYLPVGALQCHAADASNGAVQIWNLSFEPQIGRNNATTSQFASVGGDAVCFVECKTNKVRAKYVKEGEEFFSVAWSYFSDELNQGDTFVAAGGKGICGNNPYDKGLVYIISPTEGACLQKIKVSKKWSVNVNTISFCHPSDPSMMLVACAGKGDFELTGWSVTKAKTTKLIRFGGINSTPIRTLMPSCAEYLLCATETGIHFWSMEDIDGAKREERPPLGKLLHPSLPEDNQVDGLVQLGDDLLVSKCANSGVLFTWHYRDLLSEARDGQSIIIEPLKIFNWSNTDELYININSNRLTGKFLSGDEKGRIWIYKPDLDGSEMQDAVDIIPFPIVHRDHGLDKLDTTIINDVIISSDDKFIAAGTNNNLILIFKLSNH